ncbi:Cpt-6 [Aphelenchoides besseyi]|nr:Cpt-6 [Aphelenchoides besseyi]
MTVITEKPKRKVTPPFGFHYHYPSKVNRLMTKIYNEIFNQLYPIRPLIFGTSFVVATCYFYAHPSYVPHRFAFGEYGPLIFGFFVTMIPVVVLRAFLNLFFFRYKGHLFETPKTQSMTTRFWALCYYAMKKYAPPRLLTCNRLLPKQPVPSLHATLLEYLATMDPVCEQEDFVHLQSLIPRFLCVDGPQLQRKARLSAWLTPNYVTPHWEKYVYLARRDPLMINTSVCSVDFVGIPNYSQARRAANIAYLTTLQMLSFGDESQRPPASGLVYSGYYKRLFANCRVPGREIDHWEPREYARHVVAYSNGCFYRVEMFDAKTDRIYSLDELTEVMTELLNRSDTPTDAESKVAAFAHDRRDCWAENRERFFKQNPVNSKFLEEVESSIFVLVLDDSEHYGYDGDNDVLSTFTRDILTGDGRRYWPDKPMNITVSRNGRAAACSEHSFADGPEYVHFMENLFGTETHFLNSSDKSDEVTARSGLQLAKRLELDMNDEMQTEVQKCYDNYVIQKNDVDLASAVFKDWGKGKIKAAKCPPDAFMQMAIQLAYYKEARKCVPTYEAAAARFYDYSRTETIRTTSRRSAAFVRAMVEDDRDSVKCANLLIAACQTHQQRSRKAMTGQGVDRHLFTLYIISKGMGIDSPFLNDYVQREWILSTTQTPYITGIMDEDNGSDQEKWLGGSFGAVAKEGYGIGYHFMGNENIVFHVSSYHSASATSSFRFRSLIIESLREMMDLF